MDVLTDSMPSLAIMLVRIALGVLFFAQAYDKIFTVGLRKFTLTIDQGVKASKVPNSFIRVSTFLSSYIELIGGVALVLGLFLPIVYLALALNIIMVMLSFSYLQAMWDMKHVFPRLAMLVFLMMTSSHQDVFVLSSFL